MSQRLAFAPRLVASALCCATPAVAAAESAEAKQTFDLPGGDAATTLAQFASVSRRQIVFMMDKVRGEQTNAIAGEFSPREALDRMLAGTALVALQDSATGGFVIKRIPAKRPAEPSQPRTKSETTSEPAPPMKRKNPLATLAAWLALTLAPLQGANTAAAQTTPAPREDKIVELSPFTVTSEADAGWVASSSLAGSRLNTPLRDTGASISVLTSEFLQDLGAIDLEEAVDYAVNVHVDLMPANATSENFGMELFDVGRVSVRGIPATATRNYYRWRLQSDSYNIDRIEENRGPNSILFGIGSAGGVLNSMTKQASLGRDFRKGSIMFGSEESYRGTVDLNQRLLDNKLAVRLNAVHSHIGSHRHHAFNETSRLHLASTFQPRQQTRLRVDFEIGDIDQVTTRAVPGQDGLSGWLAAGSPVYSTTQTSDLGNKGVSRYGNAARFTYVTNLGQAFDMRGRNRSSGTGSVILDESLLDFSANPGGPGQTRVADVRNLTVFWEEKIGANTYVELSHNRQWSDSAATVTGQGTSENANLYADPNQFLPSGQPNPHAGQMFYEGGRLNLIKVRDRNHASRLMISHEQDLGRWGNYRLAGMGEYEHRDERRNVLVEAWEGAPFNAFPENAANHVFRRHYVTPGDWSTYYVSGSADGGLLRGIPHPTDATRTLNSTFLPFNSGGQRDPVERQRTMLLGAQARYLDNRLVLAGGYRRDLLSIRNANAIRDPESRLWTVDHPEVDWFYQNFAGTTRTFGVVGHLTKNLSVFYNASNSLNLPNTGHRILPDSGPPPLSDAKGQDAGLSLSFFDGKLVARANAFEVDLVNATGGGFGGTFSNPTVLTNNVLDALLAAGAITQAQADAREIATNNAIKNQRLEGYEFNLTGRLTRNWLVTAGFSYTDGYDSEIGPEVKTWAAEAIPFFMQWPDVVTTVSGGANGFMTVRERVELWQRNAGTEFLREGAVLLGNRKKKYSFFTKYTFSEGPMKGLFAGFGWRYQSRMPTNFDNFGVLHFSKSRDEADLLLGYTLRPMRFLKNGARIQLNVRNLFDDTEPHVVRWNPAEPAVPSRAAIMAPRSWRITTSFDF